MEIFDSPATIHLIKIHFAIFCVFTMLYYTIGFEDNFSCNMDTGSVFSPIYFSAVVHTSLGFGDCTPKTTAGRRLVTVHTMVSFATTLLVLGSWRFK
ncbi:MAG: ion channel [Pontimonas sp.]